MDKILEEYLIKDVMNIVLEYLPDVRVQQLFSDVMLQLKVSFHFHFRHRDMRIFYCNGRFRGIKTSSCNYLLQIKTRQV